jgi:2-iminobutanoate/2-iminopropanoate deaminase
MKQIAIQGAPAPIGPYSQAVLLDNGTLYISGQIPINPNTGELIENSIESETNQVLDNLEALLNSAGMDFSNIVKTSIFLSDMANFGIVNEIYASKFSSNFPARETMAVKELPKSVNVEISAIAFKK